MTWYPIAFLPPQYSVASGAGYSGAVLKAYAQETSTPIPMATSKSGVTTAYGFVLNAAGYPVSSGNVIIPHVQENYKLALYPNQAAADDDSGAVWSYDDITIADAANTAFVQSFSGDGATVAFTLSQDLGTDEKTLMIFADKKFNEYSTNGAFATDTAWTKGSNITISAGVAAWSGATTSDLSQTAGYTLLAGESYTATYTVTAFTAGTVTVKVGGTAGTARGATGTFTETIVTGATDQLLKFSGAAFTGSIDNVSVHRTTSAHRQIKRTDEFTISGTTLTFTEAPATGTNNILVYAPSTLFGSVGALAAAAATSETNAAISAAAALASETAAGTAADIAIGAAGFSYNYSTTTTATDPSLGFLKFDNVTLASATKLYISETTSALQSVGVDIATWDDGTSTIRGRLRVFKQTDPSTFALFDVTGSNTDNGQWDTVNLSYVIGAGALSNNDAVTIEFFPKGDKGDTGLTGATGSAGSGIPIVTAAGTVDAITANYTPDVALSNLTLVAFVSTGANTSTTPTFAPDGLTAHTITKKGGQALVAGDIGGAGAVHMLEYNLANTRWELLNPISTNGVVTVKQQSFTSSGTYTPSTGMLYCIMELVGSGGAGGGCPATNGSAAAGGGSGRYVKSNVLTAAQIGASQTVTIGAAVTGNTSAGSGGNSTSVGALITGNGGSGGTVGAATSIVTQGGRGADTASGSQVAFSCSMPGGHGISFSTTSAVSGSGGGSPFAEGQLGRNSAADGATAAANSGGGGGGARSGGSTQNGGNSGSGFVIITEFCSQ